jgi:site-specific recombinase XerD
METGIIIPEQAGDFIFDLDVKEATRIEYKKHLDEFLKWAVNNWDVYNPRMVDIIRYKHYLGKTYKVAAANKRLTVVRSFFRWLYIKYGILNIAECVRGFKKTN